MAALLRRCPARCRSRQFSERLSFPPTNHFAKGAFNWRTFFHGARHVSSFASRVQNFTGCLIDSRYIRRYWSRLLIRAFAANSFAGLKTRFSIRCDSMLLSIFILNCGTDATNHSQPAQPKLSTTKVTKADYRKIFVSVVV